jgi:hypothetical protein
MMFPVSFRLLATAMMFASLMNSADASITISSNSTKNVVCSGGVCASTVNNGVLNVSDLQNLLASGNIKVVSTGSGHQTGDIKITAALTWVSSNTLTLDSYHSIIVNKPVTVTGAGGLTLVTNDGGTGGTFSFGPKGKIGFWSLSSSLTINGAAFTLENNLPQLGQDAGLNPAGNFALATDYDASADGAYPFAPIDGRALTGTLEGLGNQISNLSVVDTNRNDRVGLIWSIGEGGTVQNIRLVGAAIHGRGRVGSLAGENDGVVFGVTASGTVLGSAGSYIGGLVGINGGTISYSSAASEVSGGGKTKGAIIGGLVGYNVGAIANSFATGNVTDANGSTIGGLVGENGTTIAVSYASGAVSSGDGSCAGGLVGLSGGGHLTAISDSYSTGSVTAGANSNVGGFACERVYKIANSYSTGQITAGSGSTIGGFVGHDDNSFGNIANAYWDTTTSGIANSSQGAGNISNDPGITGLTTVQLQAGLPTGFDPSIWNESSTINRGLPYLLDIPPT